MSDPQDSPPTDQNSKTIGARLGEYIHYQRQKRRMTIAQFAEKAGMTAAYISRLEQGYYYSPTLEAATAMAQALRMPVQALLLKSGVTPSAQLDFPELAFYLHEKFALPPEAIDDVELFMELIFKKYAKDIKRNREQSKEYWHQDE